MARRKSGSIYRREDRPGRVYLRMTINGERVEVGSWEDTPTGKDELEKERKRILGQDADDNYLRPSAVTVGQFAERWIESRRYDVAADILSPNTLETYSMEVRSKIIPKLGAMRLRDLTPEIVKTFYADLLESGSRSGGPLAPKTVGNIGNTFRKMLDAAEEAKLIQRNPAARIRLPRGRKPTIAVWSPEETRLFIDHVAGSQYGMILRVIASTGMRRSEACGLRWQGIDLDAGTVSIFGKVVLVGLTPTYSERTKTTTSRRMVALDAGTIAMLRRHRTAGLERRLALGTDWIGDLDLVFPDEIGRPINPNRVTRAMKDEARALGLTPIGVHGLRHSYATAGLRSGESVKVISERLGHSSTSITMDRYQHYVPEADQAAAVSLAERMVGGAT